MIKHISVANKVATYSLRDGPIVCGNSGYKIKFTFDDEWADHNEKTACFIWNNQRVEVNFTGDECRVPVLSNTTLCEIGVYAGDLLATTTVKVECKRSIRCAT